MAKVPNPASSFGRIDLPIRDVLRFIIPGGYGAVSAALLDHVLFEGKLGLANSAILVPVGFLFGLVAFVGEFHTRFWPWRRRWHREMDSIAKEINAISGHELARREEFARPIYKLWIEAVCPADLRGYLHYNTGLYYSTVAVSVLSVAGAFVSMMWLVFRAVSRILAAGLPGVKAFASSTDLLVGAGCIVGFVLMARLSYRMSRGNLIDVAFQGRIAMELETSRDELVRLAEAATRTAADFDDKLAIQAIVKDVVREICPADLELFQAAQCDGIVDQVDARDGTSRRVAHVTATSSDPVELNGGPNLYEGERQRMLESTLAMRLCGRLNVDAVRLQIEPIGDFWKLEFRSSTKRIRVLPLEQALALKVLVKDSPIDRCCREYGISKVFLRGRYVVGPSPGLAVVVKQELLNIKTAPRVFDPFAGTRLVECICRRETTGAVVEGQDRIDPNGNASNVDSFTAAPPSGDYDLVVLDPLYEDCLPYLELVAPKLHAAKWIVQSGRACDVGWNAKIEAALKRFGTVERAQANTFGSRIFVVTSR